MQISPSFNHLQNLPDSPFHTFPSFPISWIRIVNFLALLIATSLSSFSSRSMPSKSDHNNLRFQQVSGNVALGQVNLLNRDELVVVGIIDDHFWLTQSTVMLKDRSKVNMLWIHFQFIIHNGRFPRIQMLKDKCLDDLFSLYQWVKHIFIISDTRQLKFLNTIM